MIKTIVHAADSFKQRFCFWGFAVLVGLCPALGPNPLCAATIFIPNGSFESPVTDFASPAMDAWEKASKPAWYNDPRSPWDQLMGQFLNTTNGSPNHITNLEGRQAVFLFALPEVAIYQDYATGIGTNASASHPFNAQFEAGKSYALT